MATSPVVRKAALQETAGGGVRCLLCERRCRLAEGELGWCRTRVNRGGTLYTLSPEAFGRETAPQGCQGTSISFNEPTLSFEWAVEAFRLARARGLYNTFVTNGYMTAAALDALAAGGLRRLDA